MIRNLEYQNQQLKKQVGELKGNQDLSQFKNYYEIESQLRDCEKKLIEANQTVDEKDIHIKALKVYIERLEVQAGVKNENTSSTNQ